MKEQNQIEIHKANDGFSQISVKFKQETVWLTLDQMATLFALRKTFSTKSNSSMSEVVIYKTKNKIEISV